LKNYFFFFAAGFLATAFVAGFFFAATVTHLPSGVEGPDDDSVLITAGTYWMVVSSLNCRLPVAFAHIQQPKNDKSNLT